MPTVGQLREWHRYLSAECSWRWASDLWHGLDLDWCHGKRHTGRGTRKARCLGHADRPGCLRWVPPQDLRLDKTARPWPPAADWPPDPAVQGPLPAPLQGPPPPPALLCTDCAMAHWDPREPREDLTVERGIRLEQYGYARLGEFAAVEFTDLISADDDRSPTTAALEAMAASDDPGPREDQLPTGGSGDVDDAADREQLAAAIEAYRHVEATDGEEAAVRKFEDLTGDAAARTAQARRRRYGATRSISI